MTIVLILKWKTYRHPIYTFYQDSLGYLAKIWESPKLAITKVPIKPGSILHP
jgi:hypothetical protein